MVKTYKQRGKVVEFTAGQAYSSGDPIVIGNTFGVVLEDVANGALGQAQISDGVYEVALKAADDPTQGEALYWDAGNTELTLSPAGNVYAGTCWKTPASGATLVELKLAGFGDRRRYSQTINPASVAANTTAEETFTVTGLKVGDVVAVNAQATTTGLAIGNVRVSAADTLAIQFVNVTASPIDAGGFTIEVVVLN